MRKLEIKTQAEKLLRDIKFRKPPVSQNDIAKLLGVTVRIGPLPDGLSGFLLRENGRAIIGINSLHSKTRQAFTFAHECGHFILHPKHNFVDRSFVYYRNNTSGAASDKREVEANTFAAELLMPESEVRKLLRGKIIDMEDDEKILELSNHFGVSTQALTYRLINLHLAHE